MQIFLLSTSRMGTANNICAFRRLMLKYTCLPGTSRGSKCCVTKQANKALIRNKLIFISGYWDQWLKTSGRLGRISAAELRLRLYEERPTFWRELSEELRALQQQNPCWEFWPGVTLAASWEREEGGCTAIRGRRSSQMQVQLHLSGGKMHKTIHPREPLLEPCFSNSTWARS